MARRKRSRTGCKIVRRRVGGKLRNVYGKGCPKAGQFAKGKATVKRRRRRAKRR